MLANSNSSKALVCGIITVFVVVETCFARLGLKRLDILPGGLVRVGIGTPEQQFRLLLNTGSATTWVVSANDLSANEYLKVQNRYSGWNSSTHRRIGNWWNAEYGVGLWAYGSLEQDDMSLGDLVVRQQEFGQTEEMKGFVARHINLDGVLGLGSLTDFRIKLVDPIEGLYEQNLIDEPTFGLIYADIASNGDEDPIGQLILGGTDHRLYRDDMIYVPIKNKWQIPVRSIRTSGEKADSSASIWMDVYLDSSSAIIMLPEEMVAKILLNYPTHYDRLASMQVLDDCRPREGPDLVINIGHRDFIIPREDLIIKLDGAQQPYCISALQAGDQFILGTPFLKNHYTTFDSLERRVGLSKPTWTKPRVYPTDQQTSRMLVQNLRKTITGDLYYATIGIGHQEFNLLLGTSDRYSWVMSAANFEGITGVGTSNDGKRINVNQGYDHDLMKLVTHYDLYMYPIRIAENTTLPYPMGVSNALEGDIEPFKRLEVAGILALEHLSDPNEAYRSLMLRLKVYRKIGTKVVSLHLNKASKAEDSSAGSLVFGGIDHNLYKGSIKYVPYHKGGLNNWALKLIGVQLEWRRNSSLPGDSELKPESITRSVVFEKLNRLQLVMDSKDRYFSGDISYLNELFIGNLGASPMDANEEGRIIYLFDDCNLNSKPDILFLMENNLEFRVAPEQYLVELDNDSSKCKSTFLGTPKSSTITFGTKFMEDYYLIYDYDSEQVGFAQAV